MIEKRTTRLRFKSIFFRLCTLKQRSCYLVITFLVCAIACDNPNIHDPAREGAGRHGRPCEALLAALQPTIVPQIVSRIPREESEDNVVFTSLSYAASRKLFYATSNLGVVWAGARNGDAISWTPVLNIEDRVHSFPDGLIGVTVPPAAHDNGKTLFAMYNVEKGGVSQVRISRFDSDDAESKEPTETVLVETTQPPHGNRIHSGGTIGFDAEGYFYASIGDGREVSQEDIEARGASTHPSQDLRVLFGKMLRLDVLARRSAGTEPQYTIPPDNPFVGRRGGVRAEIWALGLRNPFRWSIDDETNQIWLADVGQVQREEINQVSAGANLGWPYYEGDLCFAAANGDCGKKGLTSPAYAYGRDLGAAVVGGFVYRGDSLPGLNERYLFADFVNASLRALSLDDSENAIVDVTTLPTQPVSIIAGPDGEPYFFGLDGTLGTLRSTLNAASDTTNTLLPDRLSATGCLKSGALHSAFVPYDVNSPLWSDGAEKQRYVYIEPGATVLATSEGELRIPRGSILVKEFYRNDRHLETRLLIQSIDGHWSAFSYAWNKEQNDAFRAPGGVHIHDGTSLGWTVPSEPQCFQCHAAANGYTLGMHMAQLNGATPLLDDWKAQGLLPKDTNISFDGPDAMVPVDTSPLGHAVRSYLHVNCASCHRPGGTALGNMDLRYTTALMDTGLCGESTVSNLGLASNRLVHPGDPDNSVLFARLSRLEGAMPPLGTELVDENAVGRFRQWITQLQACEETP